MERKEREKETRRAPQAGVHMTVHDLTAEELCVLDALRDPVKGERIRKIYCGGSQSKQGE